MIRYANKEDVPHILDFIKKLAEYENMSADVCADEVLLSQWIFDKKKAEVILIFEECDDKKPVGFALYFYNFSTFLGRAGIYLEDLFVLKEKRGCGYGTKLLDFLEQKCVEENLGRLDWSCLKWNKPSLDIYEKRGATQLTEWVGLRKTFEN